MRFTPSIKGGAIEVNRINRILRDEKFVDKKLAALTTEDLQDFITDRLTEVAPATVDRDLDILSQVSRYAADVWKIAAFESPFTGLRRPKYFNERDRRFASVNLHPLVTASPPELQHRALGSFRLRGSCLVGSPINTSSGGPLNAAPGACPPQPFGCLRAGALRNLFACCSLSCVSPPLSVIL